MHLLFVHQNFPAQFRCIAPRLARDYGWTCTFATSNDRIPAPAGVDKVIYRLRGAPSPVEHFAVRRFSAASRSKKGSGVFLVEKGVGSLFDRRGVPR